MQYFPRYESVTIGTTPVLICHSVDGSAMERLNFSFRNITAAAGTVITIKLGSPPTSITDGEMLGSDPSGGGAQLGDKYWDGGLPNYALYQGAIWAVADAAARTLQVNEATVIR